jgi:hypothetical protein
MTGVERADLAALPPNFVEVSMEEESMAKKPGDDAFLDYLYSFRPGEVGDRQRWLAWAAMVTLLAKAGRTVRRQWERRFYELSRIEHDATLTDAEQGRAFMDLLAPLWPNRPPRGRPAEDPHALFLNFDMLMAVFEPVWRQGDAAKLAAIDLVLRVNKGKLSIEKEDRVEIVKCRSPRVAAIKLLAHLRGDFDSPGGSERTTEQALYRAGRRSPRR